MLSSSLRNPAVRRWAATTNSSFRWASTLVISDPLNEAGETPPGTQSAVNAAGKFGQAVALLVVGASPPKKIPETVTIVYYVGVGDKLSETVASSIQAVAISKDCNIIVGTASKSGSTVIPRAAALLESSPITDILEIQDASTCNNEILGRIRISSRLGYASF
jgi:electron transfer flavoprotein alpha subunit